MGVVVMVAVVMGQVIMGWWWWWWFVTLAAKMIDSDSSGVVSSGESGEGKETTENKVRGSKSSVAYAHHALLYRFLRLSNCFLIFLVELQIHC